MKLLDLSSFDPTLKFVKNKEWPKDILATSSFENPLLQSLVFIKNQKFLEKFLVHLDMARSLEVGLIIDESLFHNLADEVRLKVDLLPWLATSPDISLSLTLLSKPFYDEKMHGINTQVDGRQMGTTRIHPSAYVAQNVFIGENVTIDAGVEIMPGTVILPYSEIGKNTKIFPNVTLYPFTKIGAYCTIHSGVAIGSDGFGYTFNQGIHAKIWHMGGVEIQDNVEIGSNSSIDMGTFSPTLIGEGTKIDNLVQIAHNVKIGRGCIICGQGGIAGSAVLEDYVVMGGRAAVGPDCFIGAGTQIAGGAMVNEGASWPAGSRLGGHPAKDLREWMKGVAYLRSMSLKKKQGVKSVDE